MRIEPFILEEWMQKYEGEEVYNLDNSCVYALSLIEFKNLIGIEEQEILNMFRNIQLSYGGYATGGNPILLAEIAKLYDKSTSNYDYFWWNCSESSCVFLFT